MIAANICWPHDFGMHFSSPNDPAAMPAGVSFGPAGISVDLLTSKDLPIRVEAFFSTCNEFSAELIRWATDDKWSHCGLVFTFRDGNMVYVEALFGTNVTEKPISHLRDWQRKDPTGRIVEFVPIPVDAQAAARMYLIAKTWIGSATYGTFQLIAQLAFEKWGIPVPRSMGKVVCCELVARVAYPDADLRSECRSFDETTPGSVYRRLLQFNRQKGISL